MMSETELYGDKVQCKCGGWHLHPCGTAKGAASWRSHQDTQQHNHHGGKKQTRHVARFDAEEEAARNLARNQRSYAYGGGGYMNDGNANGGGYGGGYGSGYGGGYGGATGSGSGY